MFATLQPVVTQRDQLAPHEWITDAKTHTMWWLSRPVRVVIRWETSIASLHFGATHRRHTTADVVAE